jgi:hypothetical protein
MKSKKHMEEVNFDVEEIIGTLKESDKHDWAKSVLRISWDSRPATIDIRSFNFNNNKPGKGISLSDEEVDELVNLLVEKDYGSLDILTKAISKKKSRLSGVDEDGIYRIRVVV